MDVFGVPVELIAVDCLHGSLWCSMCVTCYSLVTWMCLVFQLSDLLDKRKQDLQVKLDEIRKEADRDKEEVRVIVQSCNKHCQVRLGRSQDENHLLDNDDEC